MVFFAFLAFEMLIWLIGINVRWCNFSLVRYSAKEHTQRRFLVVCVENILEYIRLQ